LWSNWWNEDWQGKPKYSEKTLIILLQIVLLFTLLSSLSDLRVLSAFCLRFVLFPYKEVQYSSELG
jgi:hypothetical protein